MTRSVALSSKQIPASTDARTLLDLVLINEIVVKDPPQLADRLRSYTDRHSPSLLNHGAAIGIALHTRYSRLKRSLDELSLKSIITVLHVLGSQLYDCAPNKQGSAGLCHILTGLGGLQRQLGGKLSITPLNRIGAGGEVYEMNDVTLDQALCEMNPGENTCN